MSRGQTLDGAALDTPTVWDCDTLIIGSGAGGAVVAAERAAAGERALVVEEGANVRPQELSAMRPSESLQSVWRGAGTMSAFGLRDTPVINVTMGRCVGGSSVLTGGVCFRTPEAVLAQWVNERGLTQLSAAHLEPWFEEVERDCHISDVPVDMRSRSTTLFGEGAQRLGYGLRPTKRNTKGCDGCSQCNFGCPQGAKMSVDLTYLARASAAGATILSRCRVNKLTFDGTTATGATGHLLDATRKERCPVTLRAKQVVLAAGSVHTPQLLWRSPVGRRGKQIGRNMTLHPSFRMLARFDTPVRGWRGAMQSAYSDEFEHERVTLMSVFVPPFAIATGVPGIGADFTNRVQHLDHLAMFGGMIHDEAGGRLVRGPGRDPIMLYRMSREDRAAVPRIIQRLGEGFLAAGATELYLPVLGHAPVTADEFRALDLTKLRAKQLECSSQHPMGTCRMGSDAKHSVVDEWGRVWGTRGLWIADGSVVPTSLGVNPQQTIMAMAMRIGRSMTDAPAQQA